jgi:hypothetical protein
MDRKTNNFKPTCKVFLWKIAKEKRFYRKRNLYCNLLPILVYFLLLILNTLEIQEETIQKNEIFNSETEVR